MKIGVDFDDVLSQTMQAIADFHNENYGTHLTFEDMTSTNFEEIWGGTREEAVKKIHDFHFSPYGLNTPSIEGAREVLEKLKKNNELFVITARNDETRKISGEWVEKNFPGIFSGIYFTNQFANKAITTKHKVCDNLNIDIFIDDNFKYASDCVKPNRKVFLFNYPWNQSEALPEGITRINSWKELGEFLL